MSAVQAKEAFASLVLRLRGRGLAEQKLLAALEATPRELFVPNAFVDLAYRPHALPIECGEAMEGADAAAQLIAMMRLRPEHRVLEVGTGSGYTAAVMSRLATKVTSLERYRTLIASARQRFETLAFQNLVVRHADGSAGARNEGPFDRVLVTASSEMVPRQFVDHVVSGGEMIAPIGPAMGEQMLVRLTKTGNRFEREDLYPVRYQPLLSGVAAAL